jgi:stage III sporulation protein AD
MERLVLIALIGSVTAIQMRSVRHEYAILIGGATTALLLLESLIRFTGVSGALSSICTEYGVPTGLLSAVLKIVGIAYLTDFGVNISKDAGQTAIAGALETGGRILILSCTLPTLVTLLETGAMLIREAAS